MYQPVTVSLNTCSQMHVQIKHSLAHLQDFIFTLAGVFEYVFHTNSTKVRIKPCRCARECFICTLCLSLLCQHNCENNRLQIW